MAGKITKTPEERFWLKVIRNGECLDWSANKNKKGYGRFWYAGRNEFAPRMAWRLSGREIPNDDLRVLHKCDNPSCVNVRHLFLGTFADNIRDRDAKGRTARGERNGNRKLTTKDVLAIRRSNSSCAELARQFQINKTQVWNILKRHQWKHI